MPREQLLGLAADVDRLLAAGATAAAGHDGLSRRGRTLRELGQKVAALLPVADAVERVTSSSPREVGRSFLDLMVMARQLRGSLAAAGAEGTLQAIEASGPWQTPTPARDVYDAHESLTGEASSSALHDAAERQVTGDLRLLPSALAALESGNSSLADLVADKLLPAVGRGVLSDLLVKLELPKGKAADARRLRAVCKIDPKIGAELVRKGLSEGSPALKIQALECLPDVGRPGEAEKVGLEMWKEKKKDMRVAALGALREATSDEALEVLMKALLLDDYDFVYPAMQLLAGLPHPKTTERLLRQVEERTVSLPPPVPKPKKGAKKEVRRAAEKAEEEREKIVEHLRRFITVFDGRKDVSRAHLLKTLLSLTHHAEGAIRYEAVGDLAKFGPDVKEVVPALIEALGDADYEVAGEAAQALSGFPPEKRETAMPAVIAWARNVGKNNYTIDCLADMLPKHMQRFGDEILDVLGQLLEKKDLDLRNSALQTLSEIGPPARKLLRRILEQVKIGDVPTDFSKVFANIEPEGATVIPALIELLKDRKARTRANALQGLIGYGTKAQAAEPLVIKLTKDRDWWVKSQAESTLAAIKGEN